MVNNWLHFWLPVVIKTVGASDCKGYKTLSPFDSPHQLHFFGLSGKSGSLFVCWLSLKFQHLERFSSSPHDIEKPWCTLKWRRNSVGCLVLHDEKRSPSYWRRFAKNTVLNSSSTPVVTRESSPQMPQDEGEASFVSNNKKRTEIVKDTIRCYAITMWIWLRITTRFPLFSS